VAIPRCWCSLSDADRPDDRTRAVPSGGPGSRSRDRLIRTGVEIVRERKREREREGERERKRMREREREKWSAYPFPRSGRAPTEADAEKRDVLSPRASLANSRDVIRDRSTAGESRSTRGGGRRGGGPRALLWSLLFHGALARFHARDDPLHLPRLSHARAIRVNSTDARRRAADAR